MTSTSESKGNCEACGQIAAVVLCVAGPLTSITAWFNRFDWFVRECTIREEAYLCHGCKEDYAAVRKS